MTLIVFFCYTLHLYEPFGTTDLRMKEDERCVREVDLHILCHHSTVGKIAEIDDEILHITRRSASIGKQCPNVPQQSLHLFFDLSEIEHVAFTVNTCRAGDIIHLFVGKHEACTALEGHTIFLRGIETGGGVQIFQLISTDTR